MFNIETYLPFCSNYQDYDFLDETDELLEGFFFPILQEKFHFILFAFGEEEIAASKDQFLNNKNIELISKNLSLTEQMEIINKCKVFISLDSANMHLASLTSTPVVSIWGPTHPFLGFSPLFNDEFVVQLNKNELPCRPCSVYGKIRKKNIDCAQKSMINITSEMVFEKVNLALKN